MQKFEMPKLSVEEFEIVDVIMTGSIEDPVVPTENELPDGEWE